MGMWSLWAATEVEPHSLSIAQNGPSAAAMDALRGPFAVLEDALADGFLIGGRFTVADINVRDRPLCRRRHGALQGSAQTEGLAEPVGLVPPIAECGMHERKSRPEPPVFRPSDDVAMLQREPVPTRRRMARLGHAASSGPPRPSPWRPRQARRAIASRPWPAEASMRILAETAERSIVTVLAVDTVNSTGHIAGDDPDDAQELLDRIFEHLDGTIRRPAA